MVILSILEFNIQFLIDCKSVVWYFSRYELQKSYEFHTDYFQESKEMTKQARQKFYFLHERKLNVDSTLLSSSYLFLSTFIERLYLTIALISDDFI